MLYRYEDANDRLSYEYYEYANRGRAEEDQYANPNEDRNYDNSQQQQQQQQNDRDYDEEEDMDDGEEGDVEEETGTMNSSAMMGSDLDGDITDEDLEDGRDLEQTVYWGDKGIDSARHPGKFRIFFFSKINGYRKVLKEYLV